MTKLDETTRRDFIKQVGAGAVAGTVAPRERLDASRQAPAMANGRVTSPAGCACSCARAGDEADVEAVVRANSSAPSLSFDERLGMLVDAEQLARDNRALTRRLKGPNSA
jgi:anaerobic selenocysteine-containing dehydrogenase